MRNGAFVLSALGDVRAPGTHLMPILCAPGCVSWVSCPFSTSIEKKNKGVGAPAMVRGVCACRSGGGNSENTRVSRDSVVCAREIGVSCMFEPGTALRPTRDDPPCFEDCYDLRALRVRAVGGAA